MLTNGDRKTNSFGKLVRQKVGGEAVFPQCGNLEPRPSFVTRMSVACRRKIEELLVEARAAVEEDRRNNLGILGAPKKAPSAVPMPVPLHSRSSSPPDDGAALNAYLQNGRRYVEELHSSSITSVPEDSKSDAFEMSFTGSDKSDAFEKSDGDVFRLSFNPERYSPPPNPSYSQNAPSHSQAGQIESATSTSTARPIESATSTSTARPNPLARPTMMAESPRSRSFMGGLLGSSRW